MGDDKKIPAERAPDVAVVFTVCCIEIVVGVELFTPDPTELLPVAVVVAEEIVANDDDVMDDAASHPPVASR